MILQSLTLRYFRNHTHLELPVDPGINLFIGSNGAGKTNLVEAISVLTTGASPRGADSESMVQWNEPGFSVEGRFGYDNQEIDPVTLEIRYKKGSSRIIRENGKVAVRLKDLLGRVPIVSFVPEDLALVKGEPEIRRRALNFVLMQTDPAYTESLKRYNESLRARNAALKQVTKEGLDEAALVPWDNAVVEHGLRVCQKRDAFLNEFSGRVSRIHKHISGGKEIIHLRYKPSFQGPWDESAATRWHESMINLRAQELAMGITVLGPHRDDIEFVINDRLARSFASEGQARTGAVSFKLAEIPYIKEKMDKTPLCILDDVLSELDHERAEHLLAEISETGQCFVTLTGLEAWPKKQTIPASVYSVTESGVTLSNESYSVTA